jgi:hypothetical protein
MSKIKSFKEVLSIAITDDSVKVIKILDTVLDITTKNTIIDSVTIERESKAIINQLELELEFNC